MTNRPGKFLLPPCLLVLLLVPVWSQQVKVQIDEGKPEVIETVLPVDPTPVVQFGTASQSMMFGLSYKGQRITFSPAGGHDIHIKVDGQEMVVGQPQAGKWEPMREDLKPKPGGKKRHGVRSTWVVKNLYITQILEIVPTKPLGSGQPGQKRQYDTLLVKYVIENKDAKAHKLAIRHTIDMFIVNNDGAQFASPETHKGQVLNGIEFKGNKMPSYVQCLQNPNLANPGQVAHFTLKFNNKLEGPERIVLTGLGAWFMGGDVAAMASGDTAVALFFKEHDIPAGGKREMAYAYGIGRAHDLESEGRVHLTFGGSFEPNKLFTITAQVDDPIVGQALTLVLPAEIERVEGSRRRNR